MEQCIYLGIDGCKFGWWAWSIEDGRMTGGLFSGLEALLSQYDQPIHCLIDMPIGFSDSESPDRQCDKAARRKLTKVKQSSIFPVPCRDAVYSDSYLQGCELNMKEVGKKFSKQTWGIVPKIRELDEHLRRAEVGYNDVIRESHPEVLFAQLAGKPLETNKRTSEGRDERIALLETLHPSLGKAVHQATNKTLRKHVMPDDIIDALVLCMASQSALHLTRLPDKADYDRYGNCREIVYPKSFSLPEIEQIVLMEEPFETQMP
ncbi:DUF429 domain-containing protein [Vibrio astriarenae]|uniref:DUF429 domain-containing protein n=1 Tax=Vibrio astriarenae TaxID=1481923 RepID=UPI003736298C